MKLFKNERMKFSGAATSTTVMVGLSE